MGVGSYTLTKEPLCNGAVCVLAETEVESPSALSRGRELFFITLRLMELADFMLWSITKKTFLEPSGFT